MTSELENGQTQLQEYINSCKGLDMLRAVIISIASDINSRVVLTKQTFKITELCFKYCSWFLGLIAITYAARTSHSRIIYALSAVLSGVIFLPITEFISYPYGMENKSNVNPEKLFLIRLTFVMIGGALLTWRLRVIVDAIIVSQH